jgi:hypothetical protein
MYASRKRHRRDFDPTLYKDRNLIETRIAISLNATSTS